LLGLVAVAAVAAEVGTTRQEATLMSAPYSDATTAGRLAANTKVTLFERRGAWLRVTAGNQKGWVRLHQVRIGEGTDKSASGSEGLGMLWNVGQTGRSGSQGIVATTGIRGLTAEELKLAKPNPQAVQSLDQYRASADTARRLAASGGLKDSNEVDFLPKPD
jgi:hypothetical protein